MTGNQSQLGANAPSHLWISQRRTSTKLIIFNYKFSALQLCTNLLSYPAKFCWLGRQQVGTKFLIFSPICTRTNIQYSAKVCIFIFPNLLYSADEVFDFPD